MKARNSDQRRRKSRKLPLVGTSQPTAADNNSKSFPIVGLGASAGGLEACIRLLEPLPAATGMAFVLVQHLAPKHASALTELLARHTKMSVTKVTDRMKIVPNHVYVIPPDAQMVVLNGLLHLIPREASIPHLPIDFFFQSLAQDRQHQAIGVILSGTASDGMLGLKAIKAAGGVTFAQDADSARFGGMPLNAISSGAVDFVLPPEEIASKLARISGKLELLTLREAADTDLPAPTDDNDLEKIFALLRVRTRTDFTHYKRATVRRRIQRRMLLCDVASLHDYLLVLQQEPSECEALHDDALIHVTSFFRDPQSFEALKRKVFPSLLKGRARGSPIRLWVPGCSTGEDAYSLVISLLEFLSEESPRTPVQAFATDISEKAIGFARRGFYPEAIISQVSPARIERYFVKSEQGFQVGKSLRSLVVFARHDVTCDPPYSRIDLVSCRNLLIFLDSTIQKNVFASFLYALNPGGFLELGASETVGEFGPYFAVSDRKHKIYAKRYTATPPPLNFGSMGLAPAEAFAAPPVPQSAQATLADLAREADRLTIERYAPPGVLVNNDFDVLHFRGHVGPYFAPRPGAATLNLLKIARDDLIYELRSAMQKARKSKAQVRSEGVRLKFNGHTRLVNLRVIPMRAAVVGKPHYLILFEAASHSSQRAAREHAPEREARRPPAEKSEILRLENELGAAKEYLRTSLEDQEVVNEELRATNEELLSTNEELQTANEELEVAKEELQSANEELTTVNEELQNRNLQLVQVTGDLTHILGTIYGGVVFVDHESRVRFVTSAAQKTLNLVPADVGRPIAGIRPAVNIANLDRLVGDVIGGGPPREIEVSGPEDSAYSMAIRPYLASSGRIEGAVIAMTDVTEARGVRDALGESELELDSILESSPSATFLKDTEGRYMFVNARYQELCGLPREQIIGKADLEIFPPPQAEIFVTHDREVLQTGIPGIFEEVVPRENGQRTGVVNRFPLRDRKGMIYALCGIVTDITQRIIAEQALQTALEQLQEKAQLLDLAHDAILVQDLNGIVKFWSPGAERIYGWTQDEALGKNIKILLQSELPEPEDAVSAKMLRDGAWEDEIVQTRRDGSKVTVASRRVLRRNAAGEPLDYFAIDRDISEHKQARRNIQQLLEAAPDPIVVVNAKREMLLVNCQMEKVFGYGREELLGRTVEELVPNRFRESHVAHCADYFREPRTRTMGGSGLDLCARRKDGTEFPAEISLSTLETQQGQLVTAVIRDISERRRTEALTRQLSARRVQVQDEERQRVSRHLHDAIGPSLTALVMQLSLIERSRKTLGSEARRALRESVALAKQCAAETRTVAYQLHPPLLDEAGLEAALRGYLESFGRLSGIQVNLQFPAEMPRLPKEAELAVFRIVQEALSNIHRHSGSKTAEVKFSLEDGRARIEIKDHGRGVPKGALEGLGIRGMKERVDHLKGKFEFASEKRGSTLRASFPVPEVTAN